MSEFAEIPPPLYEEFLSADGNGAASVNAEPEQVLSAKYMYFEDRAAKQDSQES